MLAESMMLARLTAHMGALDTLLAGKSQNLNQKVRNLVNDLETGRTHIWYVSDGGISRIVVQIESRTLRLDGPPSQGVLSKWNDDFEVRALRRETEVVLDNLCDQFGI